jgi:hypothetical protein
LPVDRNLVDVQLKQSLRFIRRNLYAARADGLGMCACIRRWKQLFYPFPVLWNDPPRARCLDGSFAPRLGIVLLLSPPIAPNKIFGMPRIMRDFKNPHDLASHMFGAFSFGHIDRREGARLRQPQIS